MIYAWVRAETAFGVGVRGQRTKFTGRYNRILSKAQFWDGRADSLEAQAVGPIANPIEMGNTHEASVKTVSGISGIESSSNESLKMASTSTTSERRRRSSGWSRGPWDTMRTMLLRNSKSNLRVSRIS